GELKQGRTSVAEYTRKFNELVCFSSDDTGALSERAEMKKYWYGLRGDIAHAVSIQSIANFGDLIQKAYSAEYAIIASNQGT
ncbi:hypothetical protein A2U01_0078034, partial [Trifolium medium]|nr:hypothetical protein [Trifolium medium]